MQKVLYFEPFNGVSGDMVLGALLDLGLPLSFLDSELRKLGVKGYELRCEPIERQGLRGTRFQVVFTEAVPPHDRCHGSGTHGHSRHFGDIRNLIETSKLDPWVKDHSIKIFEQLGRAEAKVHGTSLESVHFHEVGAVDSIVDIVGACIGFRHFRIDRFFTAPLVLGGGSVTFSHGTWPVPAPATVELLRDFPVRPGTVQSELTTPTGAAIVTTLAERHTEIPVCEFGNSGYGAGEREFEEIPNMLRIQIGRLSDEGRPRANRSFAGEDEVVLLEATIDDMDGETLGYFLELALRQGALDVYYAPLHMKKSRPGVMLSLLCRTQDSERMARLIFSETTTLGLRRIPCRRLVLEREIRRVETEFGPVGFKLAKSGDRVVNIWPEYEDLKRVAEQTGKPLKELRTYMIRIAEELES